MDEWSLALVSAFWLGLMTSISPCPLATNVAAISYIAKGLQRPANVLATGFFYSLGRMLTYLLLGALLVGSLLSSLDVSVWLQKYMNILLGPLLIIVGMFLLEMLSISLPLGGKFLEQMKAGINPRGALGAVGLGSLFALSFCPTSAALFFGSVLPLALQHQSSIAVPAIYGMATAIPVIVFALLLAFGTHTMARAYHHIVSFERWARIVTGIFFILVGCYYSWAHIFAPVLT